MKRNPRIITKTIDNKIMLLDPMVGEMRLLNQTAGMIWKMLGNKLKPMQIAKQLSTAFNVSENEAYKDVQKLIKEYIDAGLILRKK